MIIGYNIADFDYIIYFFLVMSRVLSWTEFSVQKEELMIKLPYGGQFDEKALVAHIKASGRNFIIQGQQALSLANHTKPQSLDYWLRQFASNPDTKQAENSVLDDLVATGLFRIEHNLDCPDSGRKCKGLRLVTPCVVRRMPK